MKKKKGDASFSLFILSKNLSCYTFLDRNLKSCWDQFIYLHRPSEVSYIKNVLTPAEANVMIIGGHVTPKQLSYITNAYNQLQRPKLVVVLGVSAMSGGIFQNYNSIENLRDHIPVDYLVPGDHPDSDLIRVAMELLVSKVRNGEIISDERL